MRVRIPRLRRAAAQRAARLREVSPATARWGGWAARSASLGILWVCAACDAPPDANSAPPSASGLRDPDSALMLDIRSLRECEPEPHTTLGPQEYLLGVEMEVSALASQVPGNYYYASLRDGEGNLFRAGFVGCEPRLLSPPLASGQSATGFANFRLPRSAKDFTLEYDPPLAHSDKTRGPIVSRKLGR